MGLLTILRKNRQREREIRILILGLDNAGKTTIVHRLLGRDLSSISPTLGFAISTIAYGGFKLNVWDVGGQKSIRSFWRNYFEKTDAVVWVVDAADGEERLKECRKEMERVVTEERLSGATLLVLANKQDLPSALPASTISSLLGLDSPNALPGHHWAVWGCSAYDGRGLREAIGWCVSDVGGRLFLVD
ncbi:ADP-ribosylation factor-like protein 2 [Gonapodya prolifera JEL478]|uniref:ADP-ribosylation factor-like protein 2 n=1 Tax=Gonapodya prolifera (strain JEL478) TaxID=1344416 RepID=A0A139AKN7_GONPJ|nr:ADP-ribosylation factor-like protein 2 [Gonapodya prolifera JEL478]|eukprot:KXS17337.1 ADP-ribosylation factor-like protein 2 [Gonapodya prolifera JEL478]